MKNFKKGLIYAGVLAFCIGFGAYIYCNSIKKKIPDKLYIYKQDKAVFSMDIPVVGTVAVTTEILIIAWTAICVVIPTAISEPNISVVLIAIKIPLHMKIINSATTIIQPTNPSSSANIENMKSLCGSGIYKYFCLLFPSPNPNIPPDPIAYKLCTV